MKLMNRIVVTSAALVISAIVAVVSISGLVLSLIPADYGKEVLSEDVFLVRDIFLHTPIEVSAIPDVSAFTNLGYDVLVWEGTQLQFSTLNQSPPGIVESVRTLEHASEIVTGRVQNSTFVSQKRGEMHVVAIKIEPTSLVLASDFWQAALIVVPIVLLIVLGLSQFFTQKLIWRLMQPLQALSHAAKRVSNGDFSIPITPLPTDEFGEVCASFNEMQTQLLAERERNEAYERARVDLIAGLSHDIRTPLTSVQGYIQGIQDGVAKTPAQQARYLAIAHQKAGEIESLVDTLFLVSTLTTETLTLNYQVVDVQQLVQTLMNAWQEENDTVTFRLELPKQLQPLVCDFQQLQRVLTNLKTNAIKYAHANQLVITLRVEQTATVTRLVFADNGQGVNESELSHVFERFWRSEIVRNTQSGEGTGLGLAIVQAIIHAHGGCVQARNQSGFCVEIELPTRGVANENFNRRR